jgi:hypothetical protein
VAIACKATNISKDKDIFEKTRDVYDYVAKNKERISKTISVFMDSYIKGDFSEYKKIDSSFLDRQVNTALRVKKEFYSCLLSNKKAIGVEFSNKYKIIDILPLIPYKVTRFCVNAIDFVYFKSNGIKKNIVVVHYHLVVLHLSRKTTRIIMLEVVGSKVIPHSIIVSHGEFEEVKKDKLYRPKNYFGVCKKNRKKYKEAILTNKEDGHACIRRKNIPE